MISQKYQSILNLLFVFVCFQILLSQSSPIETVLDENSKNLNQIYESKDDVEEDEDKIFTRDVEQIDKNKEESIRSLIPDLTYQKKSGLGTAISKIYFAEQRFTISGFLEANNVNFLSDKSREGGDLELYYNNLFRSGTYFGYKITDNIIFNSELQFEYLRDGSKEDAYELNIEALVDFLIHPTFNIRVGNFPIPLGYVNINEEPVMFHSVNRPEVERILIPTQWLEWGGMVFGTIGMGFDYNIAVVQGLNAKNFKEGTWIRQGRDFKFNGMNDVAYIWKLEWNGLDDFTLGLGLYHGKAAQGLRGVLGERIQAEVSLGALNIFYKYNIFQLTSVLVAGRLTDTEKLFNLTGNVMGERVYGGYLDIGIDILGTVKNYVPLLTHSYGLILFARYERLDTHDKIHRELMDLDRAQKDLLIWTYGINYKPNREFVLKLNYQRRINAYQGSNTIEDPDRVEFGIGFIY